MAYPTGQELLDVEEELVHPRVTTWTQQIQEQLRVIQQVLGCGWALRVA